MTDDAIARPVVVDPWPAGGIEVTLEATLDECRRLAQRFDLVAVGRLAGQARLERGEGRVIRLYGRLEADVVQSCVVSLEDVPATVDTTFECTFTHPGAELADAVAWDQDIEPLDGPEVDLGEIFAQQLSLALDPYPRAADAYALVSGELGPNIALGEDEPAGPLAAAWINRDRGAARTAPPRQGRD